MNKQQYHRIDQLEQKLLESLQIERKQYRKGSMKYNDIHYLEFGMKNKMTILLVHGFAATGITNFLLLPMLIKSFHVIVIDLPGFGKSDRPKINFINFDKTIQFFLIPIVSLIN